MLFVLEIGGAFVGVNEPADHGAGQVHQWCDCEAVVGVGDRQETLEQMSLGNRVFRSRR